ncbi:sensor histidine kinase [Methylobacterium flocculans]|uniref:sensor histidine kinase n=1 Tax=Methylobacterium flocculans TaxID=2984843 RepID=UPI0021F330C1|nr:sensor histidine kinase [Methylobacterium sp. FF17]
MQGNPELTAAMPGAPPQAGAAPVVTWPAGSGPSIRAVLALSLAGIALAATIALAAFVTRYATGRMEAEVGTQLAEVAGHMASNLDQGMFERWRDIQIAASLDTLRSPSGALADKRAVLRSIQETYSNYSIVGLIDASGRVVATSLGLLEGVDVSGRSYFSDSRNGPYVGDLHDAVLLAKQLPRQSREPLRLLDVAAPVRDGAGNFAGVVVAHLDWTWARELASGLARSLRGHRAGSEIIILGKDGTVLLGPEALRGKPLPPGSDAAEAGVGRIGAWPDDGKVYLSATAATAGYRDYPGLGWRVVVRQDAVRALASVDELRRGILAAGGLVSLIAGLAAWLLAGRIARPMRNLASAAEALGRGEPLPPIADPIVREGRCIADALAGASDGIRRRDATQRLLIDELNHRVKNTLATVQSMAVQSFRGIGEEAAHPRRTFEARLLALSATHNILTQEGWHGADVGTLSAEAVRPFDDGRGRIVRSGPTVYLRPQQALALSLALHELATNATKHGALSVDAGRVEVTWAITEAEGGTALTVSWIERNGPAVRAPARSGFGTRLLRRGLDDHAGPEIAFAPEGLRYVASLRIDMPSHGAS